MLLIYPIRKLYLNLGLLFKEQNDLQPCLQKKEYIVLSSINNGKCQPGPCIKKKFYGRNQFRNVVSLKVLSL